MAAQMPMGKSHDGLDTSKESIDGGFQNLPLEPGCPRKSSVKPFDFALASKFGMAYT